MTAMGVILYFQSERFSYFWSSLHLDNCNEVSSQTAFRLSRRKSKYIFNKAAMAVILITDWNDLSYFYLQVG